MILSSCSVIKTKKDLVKNIPTVYIFFKNSYIDTTGNSFEKLAWSWLMLILIRFGKTEEGEEGEVFPTDRGRGGEGREQSSNLQEAEEHQRQLWWQQPGWVPPVPA